MVNILLNYMAKYQQVKAEAFQFLFLLYLIYFSFPFFSLFWPFIYSIVSITVLAIIGFPFLSSYLFIFMIMFMFVCLFVYFLSCVLLLFRGWVGWKGGWGKKIWKMVNCKPGIVLIAWICFSQIKKTSGILRDKAGFI